MGDRQRLGLRELAALSRRAGILLVVLLAPRIAGAQGKSTTTTTLTVTGGPITVGTPSFANYTAGYICAGSITASLTVATGGSRSDALLMQLAQTAPIASTSPTGYTKPLVDFQYSTTSSAGCSGGAWASVPSASPVTIHAAAAVPYSQVIWFRLSIAWTTDRGGVTYALPTVNLYVNSP